jgi:hypothetical protein
LGFSNKASGIIGGGQIGYNRQFTPNWLFGIETDFQGANLKGGWSPRMVSRRATISTAYVAYFLGPSISSQARAMSVGFLCSMQQRAALPRHGCCMK